MAKSKTTQRPFRKLDALPDTLDFRDLMYVPTLVEVPVRIELGSYLAHAVPILNQGREGACTGFGLAAVAHYLLRVRKVVSDLDQVSPRMFYEMAKRYDEWPGENYDGSSARGAMKGWNRHGVCAENDWPYFLPDGSINPDRQLTNDRSGNAIRRPLGAYFRVNHKDIIAMHSAIAEVGILYATARVHTGWMEVGSDGLIPFRDGEIGGHAFAIVAYDSEGLWLQNSWGADHGRGGFYKITYDDWLQNGSDVWVARLGAPIHIKTMRGQATSNSPSAGQSDAYTFCDLRPHIVSIGNNGLPRTDGTFGTSADDIRQIFAVDFSERTKSWKKRRLLLYAHGGLVSEDSAVQRLADHRAAMMDREIYPVSFIWKSDFWTTVTNILRDAISRRKPEGILDAAKDFMLDRLDDALEPVARTIGGKAMWAEMIENAIAATETTKGGARTALEAIRELARDPKFELHVVGHSAGSIFHAPLVKKLASKPSAGGLGILIKSCTLWAPALTMQLFKDSYVPAIKSKAINRFALFTLTDQAERDDHCANVYHKSLLYLVANSFEQWGHIPLLRDGVPLLGMEKFVAADAEIRSLFDGKRVIWVKSPNSAPDGSSRASFAAHHGDFDDDAATLRATFAHILDEDASETYFNFHTSASSKRDKRLRVACVK